MNQDRKYVPRPRQARPLICECGRAEVRHRRRVKIGMQAKTTAFIEMCDECLRIFKRIEKAA